MVWSTCSSSSARKGNKKGSCCLPKQRGPGNPTGKWMLSFIRLTLLLAGTNTNSLCREIGMRNHRELPYNHWLVLKKPREGIIHILKVSVEQTNINFLTFMQWQATGDRSMKDVVHWSLLNNQFIVLLPFFHCLLRWQQIQQHQHLPQPMLQSLSQLFLLQLQCLSQLLLQQDSTKEEGSRNIFQKEECWEC
jgi:hypothetical protein